MITDIIVGPPYANTERPAPDGLQMRFRRMDAACVPRRPCGQIAFNAEKTRGIWALFTDPAVDHATPCSKVAIADASWYLSVCVITPLKPTVV